MKTTASGGKRTNWLLIKHRDETAREGDGDALLSENATSVASGRTMERDRRGQGQGPDAVHRPGKRAAAPRQRRLAVQPRSGGRRPRPRRARQKQARAEARRKRRPPPCPTSSPPQLCQLGRPAARAATAGRHEIKFDGYRMQLRVERRQGDAEDPQGPRLDRTASRRSPQTARAPARRHHRRRGRAPWTTDGAPDFPGLQAALSDGKTGDLVFFVFDLLFDGRGPARPAAARPQGAAGGAAGKGGAGAGAHPLRRALRDRRRRGAAARPAACSWRASSPSGWTRPIVSGPVGDLDQGQVPRRPGGGDRRLDQRGGQASAR